MAAFAALASCHAAPGGSVWKSAQPPPQTRPGLGNDDLPWPAAGHRLAGVPADLEARSVELMATDCPAGTRLVERSTRRDLGRNCEDANGRFEGPWIRLSGDDQRTELFRRGSSRGGKKHGLFLTIDHAFVTEREFVEGKLQRFRRRQRSTGIRLAEGAFDAAGRVDGEWTFARPDNGAVLAQSHLTSGTGRLEVWEATASAVYPEVRLSTQTCESGLLHGPQEFLVATRWPATSDDPLVRASYERGVPHGPWVMVKGGVAVERGQYDRGRPTGVWSLVASEVCWHCAASGAKCGKRDCVSGARNVAYECGLRDGQCATLMIDGRDLRAAGPVPESGLAPPEARYQVRECGLPTNYFASGSNPD